MMYGLVVAFAQVMRMFQEHCPTDRGSDEWGCSGGLDKTEKRALHNKAFLSLPEILCEGIK